MTKQIIPKGWRLARDMIHKVNIGRWIDDLEHDQQEADDLDCKNQDNYVLVQKLHCYLYTTQIAVKKGWRLTCETMPRFSISRWINDLEHDQVVSDLNRLNHDYHEEETRKKLFAENHMMCMDSLQSHLAIFLNEHPYGTYEEWIAKLHPNNVIADDEDEDADDSSDNIDALNMTNETSVPLQINSSFYVADNDHLILWQSRYFKNDDDIEYQ
jgi:uncharacterized protein YbdZ (MbtH family)